MPIIAAASSLGGVQQQCDVASDRMAGEHALDDRAEHVGRGRGRRRLHLDAGHAGEPLR
jgi:hypothetical protein